MGKMRVSGLIFALALAALAIPAQGRASNDPTISAEQANQLWATLESLGYAVHSVEHERDKIEVEAYKDGVEYEIDFDPDTLAIIRERRDD